jgi:glucosamine--fructose-6-phosphate aminotransferase (isomerizing)
MCGVFGFVSEGGRGPNLGRLREMAKATESRGPHAFGFAWVDSRGRLKMFKAPGRISKNLGLLTMAEDAQMLIGHCRYATHGTPRNNLNNHPHPVDGGWFVHNGVIRNQPDLVEGYWLNPVTECDSEVLGLLIEELDGTLIERAIGAAQLCEGPLALLALWRSPRRLIAVRAGNPLHVGELAHGTYLASLKDGLPGTPFMLRDRSALSFAVKDNKTLMTAIALRAESEL